MQGDRLVLELSPSLCPLLVDTRDMSKKEGLKDGEMLRHEDSFLAGIGLPLEEGSLNNLVPARFSGLILSCSSLEGSQTQVTLPFFCPSNTSAPSASACVLASPVTWNVLLSSSLG